MKRKLLLAFCALLVGWSNANAQTDVTATYISNPSFEVNGSTNVDIAQTAPSNWTYSGNSDKYELHNLESITDNNFGPTAPSAGDYYYYMRRGWAGNTAKVSQVISSLPAGFYTLTAKVKTMYAISATSSYYLSANGVNASATTFTKGSTGGFGSLEWSQASVSFSITEITENVEIAFNVNWVSGGSQIAIDDVHLTVDYFATTADYNALDLAIAGAEAKTLGFETGEYAPYNHAVALKALAAAKSVDRDNPQSQTVIQGYTSTLNGATWTANASEVNAICGGDFTMYETVGGQDFPFGWNLYNTGNNSRIMGGTEGKSNTGLAATSSDKALLLKFNATYGESVGYTMPMKAGKIYKISFLYGGWGDQPNTIVSLTEPDEKAITLAPNFRPETADAHSNTEHWYNYTGYFVSTKAGDYKLKFNKVESGQKQIVIGDIELVSATELEFADGSVPTYAPGTYPQVKINRSLKADKWASAIYPFEVGTLGLTVATLTDFTDDKLVFTSGASIANKPFLMKPDNDEPNIVLYDVAVAAINATDVVEGDVTFTGKYASVEIDNSDVNYVLSNNTLMKVGDVGATINPYRAYFTVAGISSVKPLSFVVDGTATGVDSVEAVEAEEDGVLYNTAGQQVTEDYKGIVIKNGKKYYQK